MLDLDLHLDLKTEDLDLDFAGVVTSLYMHVV